MQTITVQPSDRFINSVLALSTLVAIGSLAHCVCVGKTMAQTPASEWRRTAQGWEFAHAVQSRAIHQPSVFNEHSPSRALAILSFLRKWNPVLLPVSVCLFFVTFGWWLIIGVENRGIVRRLNKAKE